jgi:hypothetical protein
VGPDHRPAFPRPTAWELLILILAAGIVAAPIYYTLIATDRPLAARSEAMIYPAEHWRALVNASPTSPIFREHLRHVEETVLVYVHQHEASFYYAGETPFVLIYITPLLLLGVFAAAWRIRTPGGLLPLLWVLATSLGNSFMIANLDSPRYVTVFPALALLAALGLRHTGALLWPDAARPRLRRIALAGLVIALAAGQTWYYFDPHLDLFNFQYRRARLDRDCEDALFRAADFPPGTQLHLISARPCDQGYARELFDYLTGSLDVATLTPADVTAVYLEDLPHTVGQAFFLEPEDQETLKVLRLYFILEPPAYTTFPIAPDKQFVLYYAPAVSQP